MYIRIAGLLMAGVMLGGCALFDKQRYSGIQVLTNNIPSSVFINGQYLEKAPLVEKNILPGTYIITIEPDDTSYVPYETTITLRKGSLAVITWKPGERPELSGGVIYEMEPLSDKNASEISFESVPEGAIVSLDGSGKEFTPIIFNNIQPGNHEYEVSLPSYETQRHTINAMAGYRMLVHIKLAKLNPINTISSVTPTQPPTNVEVQPEATASPSAEPASNSAQLQNLLGVSSSNSESNVVTTRHVVIQPTNYFEQGREVLKVRMSPNVGSREVGVVEVGKKYQYLERSQDGWHNIRFEGVDGWVSAIYSIIE